MDIQYANINELLQSDDGALELFDSLPKETQKALLERGNGVGIRESNSYGFNRQISGKTALKCSSIRQY